MNNLLINDFKLNKINFSTICDSLLFIILDCLHLELLQLLFCFNHKLTISIDVYINLQLAVINQKYKSDWSVILPIVNCNSSKFNQLVTLKARINHEEWFLIKLFDKYLCHKNYNLEICNSAKNSYNYDLFQLVKLSNGFYKIKSPFGSGYCIDSYLTMVPDRDYELANISWLIDNIVAEFITIFSVDRKRFLNLQESKFDYLNLGILSDSFEITRSLCNDKYQQNEDAELDNFESDTNFQISFDDEQIFI